MGVPMITLYGNRHAGRMVSSVLKQLELDELIAQSPDEFVEIATRLANDWPGLARLFMGASYGLSAPRNLLAACGRAWDHRPQGAEVARWASPAGTCEVVTR